MKLPFALPKQKEKPEYFLALVLRNELVNAVVFEVLAGKIKVVGQHKEQFDNLIEETPLEELLQKTDKAISTIESSLSESVETIKTIFGIKESWTEDNKIKKDYLLKLKRVSDELGLAPIGFIIIFEAIAHLIQKEEGAPATLILVETGKKIVSVALIRGGKITEIRSSEPLENIPLTVDTILKHFTSIEVLPARIVVFDGDEDRSQEFINHRWSKTLPFLHLPQVSTLSPEFDARALVFGAATQMGFEVLGDLTQEKTEEEIKPLESEKIPDNQEEFEHIEGKITQVGKESSMEYFGFIKDKDITKVPSPAKQDETSRVPDQILEDQISEIPEEVQLKEKSMQFPVLANSLFLIIKSIAQQLFLALKKIPVKKVFSNLPVFFSGRLALLIPVILGLVLIILAYVFIPRATVSIGIDPKIVKQDQNIIFSTSSKTDPSNNIVSAELVSISEEGTITTSATGKKEVGTKAKGTVTIFNNSSKTETLPSGTKLTSANGPEFTTDKSVTVASASGDIFTGTTPGKANISVTSSEIGNEYNLPSNTKLSVSGSSTIAAKNDDPFSGGTKKEIKVVSKEDIEKLTEELPKNLEKKAKDDLSKKISDDKVLLPQFINQSLKDKDFNKDVGDEASQVTLKAVVEYQGISYAKKDLLIFSDTLVRNQASADLVIDPDNLRVEVKDIKQTDDNETSANLNIIASLKPKIDETKLKKDLAGKSFENAEKLILEINQVSDVNFSLNIPFLPKRIPFMAGSIKLNFITND
ncbi:MAG: baseplate J/gp47 family protein [Candidatus Levybacteria bacterium]|nr:baseplate J/gp47 family protein [Candidatus Levybacteria bacterium]